MTRTTPPRPVDIEAVFPELAAYRGTTTRLHPRPGDPEVTASSVGGPMLWPAAEPWPVCTEPHERRLAGLGAIPMVGLCQLYRRDVPDLRPGPQGCDLLQVFWCPVGRHVAGYDPVFHVRWRDSATVGETRTAPPLPPGAGRSGNVPEPCVLHPERVGTLPDAGTLPEDLCARLDAWDEAREDELRDDSEDHAVAYQYDLSIPPGWRAGGFASWHATDPYPMDCLDCATPMELLLTIDSSEWDGGSGSWQPVEESGLHPHPNAVPTKVVVGRHGELNLFACAGDPGHRHRWSIQ